MHRWPFSLYTNKVFRVIYYRLLCKDVFRTYTKRWVIVYQKVCYDVHFFFVFDGFIREDWWSAALIEIYLQHLDQIRIFSYVITWNLKMGWPGLGKQLNDIFSILYSFCPTAPPIPALSSLPRDSLVVTRCLSHH